MSLLLRVLCCKCDSLLRRVHNVWSPTLSRLLSSNTEVDSRESGAPTETEKFEELSPVAKKFHEDMKAFFPFNSPWRLVPEHIKHFNQLPLTENRVRYMAYLDMKEQYQIKKLSNDFKKKARFQEYQETKTKEEARDPSGLPFLWTRKTTIARWENNKLWHAYMFGPEIIIDCGFDKELSSSRRLQKLFISQMSKLVINNRQFPYPSKLTLCNLAEDSELRAAINESPTLFHQPNMLSMHTESYLDLYPIDKLVYLSGDSRYEFQEYDPETIYIVGGLPDRGGEFAKASLARAREDGVRTQCIRLNKNANLAISNIVPLHQMIRLLNIARETSMENAVKSVVPQKTVEHIDQLREISAKKEKERKLILSKLRAKNIKN